MRGRTFPTMSSAFARSVSSYVQVNIYDTSLKKLRARGVDIKHLLQHVGCRSVVMDVPIFSNELTKVGGNAGHRLNKSFGGFSQRPRCSRLDKSRRCSETGGAYEAMCSAHEISLGFVREDEPLEESTVEEFADCRTDFNTTVLRGGNIGPLTSTPMPRKNMSWLTYIPNANMIVDGCHVTGSDVVEAPFVITENATQEIQTSERTVERPYFDFEGSAIVKEEPSANYDIESPVMESSFAVFQSAVVHGLNSLAENKTVALDVAVVGDDSAHHSDAEVHLSICEDCEGYCHTEHDIISAEVVQPHVVNNVQSSSMGSERVISKVTNASSCNPVTNENCVTKHSPLSTACERVMDKVHSSLANDQLDAEHQCPSESPENDVTDVLSPTVQNEVVTPTTRTKPSSGHRKRVRALTSEARQDSSHEDAEHGRCGEEEIGVKRTAKRRTVSKGEGDEGSRVFYCQFCHKALLWRPRYGKNRLVDHVRTHWGRAVKQCKLCDFKAPNFRKVHHHHNHAHPDQPYLGALSKETKEDLDELLELWKQCFPDAVDDKYIGDTLPDTGCRAYSKRRLNFFNFQ